jgi:hypothetical protein
MRWVKFEGRQWHILDAGTPCEDTGLTPCRLRSRNGNVIHAQLPSDDVSRALGMSSTSMTLLHWLDRYGWTIPGIIVIIIILRNS